MPTTYSGAAAARAIAERLMDGKFNDLRRDGVYILWDFCDRTIKLRGKESFCAVHKVGGAAAFEILRRLVDDGEALPEALFIAELNGGLFDAMNERQKEAAVARCLRQMQVGEIVDEEAGKRRLKFGLNAPDGELWFGEVDDYGLIFRDLEEQAAHFAPFVSQLGLDLTGDTNGNGAGIDEDEARAVVGKAVQIAAERGDIELPGQSGATRVCRQCGAKNGPGKRQVLGWAEADLCARCADTLAETPAVVGPEAAVPAGDR